MELEPNASASVVYTLKGATFPDINNPTWDAIEIGLGSLSSDGNYFLVLGVEGSKAFVQVSGEPKCLVVEFSEVGDDGVQKIYRLIRKGAMNTSPNIHDCGKDDPRFHLDVTDALICFEQFFTTLTVPRHYGRFDITSEV